MSFMHLQRLYIRIVEVYRQKFLQYTGEASSENARLIGWVPVRPVPCPGTGSWFSWVPPSQMMCLGTL